MKLQWGIARRHSGAGRDWTNSTITPSLPTRQPSSSTVFVTASIFSRILLLNYDKSASLRCIMNPSLWWMMCNIHHHLALTFWSKYSTKCLLFLLWNVCLQKCYYFLDDFGNCFRFLKLLWIENFEYVFVNSLWNGTSNSIITKTNDGFRF